MMCGNEQAASWCLVLTGNTTGATESEAATLKFPDVAVDVFSATSPSLQEEAARLPRHAAQHIFPPFLDPAIYSFACHPRTVHCVPPPLASQSVSQSVSMSHLASQVHPHLLQLGWACWMRMHLCYSVTQLLSQYVTSSKLGYSTLQSLQRCIRICFISDWPVFVQIFHLVFYSQ